MSQLAAFLQHELLWENFPAHVQRKLLWEISCSVLKSKDEFGIF